MALRKETKRWVIRGPRLNTVEKKFLDEQNQFSVSNGINKTENKELEMHEDNELVEISQCAAMTEFNGIRFGNWETEVKFNQSFMHKKFSCEKLSLNEGKFCAVDLKRVKRTNSGFVINNTLPFHSSELRKMANSVTKEKKSIPIQLVKKADSTGVRKICNDTSYSYGEMNDGNSIGNESKAPEFGTVRAEALPAAYRLQLGLERVRKVEIGQPLAEFERFVQSACPVISLSHTVRSASHQMPNLSLAAVWDWYHKPGSYGLEIKALEYKETTELVPFQAHFAPSLSAVQLFTYARPKKQEVNSMDDSELIFEFFESELPHLRKPLHIKIDELAHNGASNQVFGDPSKLESLNLQDLHPASWYSVAWYPIYRIPEGKFQASFVSYHSFGHLVCTSAAIVAPVLGFESYNTRDECWFDLRIPVRSLSKEFSQNKMFEILVKRLRILEENAFFFSRGCARKNNVQVLNLHPDYEFFISRKHRDCFFP